MYIKLIQPLMTLRPMDSAFKRAMAPSLALLTLAALTPREHNVTIADENVGTLQLDDSPDLVGITVNVDTFPRACVLAAHYRKRGIPVVAGGIHVSAVYDRLEGIFDAVCVGEAENVWETILEDARKGNLQKLYRSPLPARASCIPAPRWEAINPNKYLYTNVVCTSRGCPHRCAFCYNSCEYRCNRLVCRPIEDVLAEIRGLGTRHVLFIDDNFIGNVPRTRELLREMKPMKLSFNAAVSADLLENPGLLDQLAEAGCRSLFIGFETINEQNLRAVDKKQNKLADYEKLISEIHKRGIMINASLVFGFDGDTPRVFDDTLAWLIRNKIETMTAHILTPYPGTVLYKEMEAAGRITDWNPAHYNTSHVVFAPKGMTPEQLREGYLEIYKKFYTVRNIFRRLPESRKQRAPYLLFNLCYRKLGKPFGKIGSWGLMGAVGKIARRLAYGIE